MDTVKIPYHPGKLKKHQSDNEKSLPIIKACTETTTTPLSVLNRFLNPGKKLVSRPSDLARIRS
jgi:hypothetical protein